MEITLKNGRAICRAVPDGFVAEYLDSFGRVQQQAFISWAGGKQHPFGYSRHEPDGTLESGHATNLELAVAAAFGEPLLARMSRENREPQSATDGSPTSEAAMTFIDSSLAFEIGIERGVLSADAASASYAGHYMYMGTTAQGHGFKHIETRAYVWVADD